MNMNDMTSKQISDKLAEHGIKMHFNSNRQKLEEALTNILTSNEGTNMEATNVITLKPGATHTPEGVELQRDVKDEALKLIRVIVRPNDPLKRESTGEIFTVLSTEVNNGKAVKKFVPYNNEEGWHVPSIILETIKQAEYQIFKKVKRNGQDSMEPQVVKAYNVEELPPLSQKELDTLAGTQKAHNSLG